MVSEDTLLKGGAVVVAAVLGYELVKSIFGGSSVSTSQGGNTNPSATTSTSQGGASNPTITPSNTAGGSVSTSTPATSGSAQRASGFNSSSYYAINYAPVTTTTSTYAPFTSSNVNNTTSTSSVNNTSNTSTSLTVSANRTSNSEPITNTFKVLSPFS